jgi:hypothetical protein
MSIISFKKLDLTKIDSTKLKCENIYYNNDILYIRTPIVESSNIISDNDGNSHIILRFYNTQDHISFIQIIKDMSIIIKNIDCKFVKINDDVTTMKINTPVLIDNFFDKSGNIILPIEMQNKNKCVCLINFNVKNKEWVLYQYMKL